MTATTTATATHELADMCSTVCFIHTYEYQSKQPNDNDDCEARSNNNKTK